MPRPSAAPTTLQTLSGLPPASEQKPSRRGPGAFVATILPSRPFIERRTRSRVAIFNYLCKGTNYLGIGYEESDTHRDSSAQALTEYGQARNVVIDGDTVVLIQLSPSFVFRKAVDTRRFARLIYNLKRVYPIAKEANATLHAMEAHMETLATKREKQIFVKEMERALKKKYTPVLKKMTLSQGKLLIKLIDRETDQTSYELVKELRGGFRAFFWQSIARLFGANLKDTYDKEGEDMMVEELIRLYEAGLL